MAMSKKNREFFESCDAFKNYASIDEYKADIRKWLTLSSWNYTGEQADKLIEQNADYIEKAFSGREPAADAGAEVGFCCG